MYNHVSLVISEALIAPAELKVTTPDAVPVAVKASKMSIFANTATPV